MGLTVTKDADQKMTDKCGHDWKFVTGTIAWDTQYAYGGESLDFSNELPTTVKIVVAEPKSGYVFEYDYTNKKLKAFYCDYSTSTDAGLIEVATSANLSGVTDQRYFAFGY